jgi:hypothetical protein
MLGAGHNIFGGDQPSPSGPSCVKAPAPGLAAPSGPGALPFGRAASDGPLPARAGALPVSSGQPGWFRERARILKRVFSCIEKRKERGQAVRRICAHFARRWHGKTYRSAPGKAIRLSCVRLVTLYYRYLRSGKRPEILALGYKVKRTGISPALICRFLDECAAPGICSMREAWQRLPPAGISMRLLVGMVPAETRLTIRRRHQARRNLRAQEAATARFGAYQI